VKLHRYQQLTDTISTPSSRTAQLQLYCGVMSNPCHSLMCRQHSSHLTACLHYLMPTDTHPICYRESSSIFSFPFYRKNIRARQDNVKRIVFVARRMHGLSEDINTSEGIFAVPISPVNALILEMHFCASKLGSFRQTKLKTCVFRKV
jgi:hypothetical protein